MKNNKLQIEQLDARIAKFLGVVDIPVYSMGWIKTIRTTLGMSLEQLAKKLGVNKTSVKRMEEREQKGTVTINTLEEAGKAMDMKFVYGFVPADGSIEKLIERKARAIATEIVMRTSQTMGLEGQENSSKRIKKAINEKTREIMNEMPKILWD